MRYIYVILSLSRFRSLSETGLWVHNLFAVLYLILTVYSMRKHTHKMHDRQDDMVGGSVKESFVRKAPSTLFVHQ